MKKYIILLACFILLAIPINATVVTLIPNVTNYAKQNTTAQTECTVAIFNSVLNNFTDANYNSVNTSNDARYSQTVSSTSGTKCSFYTFMFNASGLTGISEVNITHEGYFTTTGGGGDLSWAELYWYNVTSGAWQDWTSSNYASETTITKSLPSSTNIIATNGAIQFGLILNAIRVLSTTTVTSYTDLANAKITYGATNTCTYPGSGNWAIDCKDNCDISSATTVTGNITIYSTGTGSVKFSSVTAKSILINATNSCIVYYTNRKVLV